MDPTLKTLLIVGAAIIAKDLLLKLWNRFWSKAVDTDYLPLVAADEYRKVTDCLHQRALCTARRGLEEKKTIEFQDLVLGEVRGLRSDIKRLDARVIKHLVHSGAPAKVIDEAIDHSIGGTD